MSLPDNQSFITWYQSGTVNDPALFSPHAIRQAELLSHNFPVPVGFCLQRLAFNYYFDFHGLTPTIIELLSTLTTQNSNEVSKKITNLIKHHPIPKNLASLLSKSLDNFPKTSLVNLHLTYSYAARTGSSLINSYYLIPAIKGDANLIAAFHQAFIQVFTPEILNFSLQQRLHSLHDLAPFICIEEHIEAEVSGTLLTNNPITGDKDSLVLEAVWGQPELLTSATLSPDVYFLNRSTRALIHQEIVDQPTCHTFAHQQVKRISVPSKFRTEAKLSPKDLNTLATLGNQIHQYYFYPQRAVWAANNGHYFILDISPTEKSTYKPSSVNISILCNLLKVATGTPASPGLVTGRLRIITSSRDLNRVTKDEIVATTLTATSLMAFGSRPAAILTKVGGLTSHLAIFARESHVPCVVAVNNFNNLKSGAIYTVNAVSGEIYAGSLPQTQSIHHTKSLEVLETRTKLFVYPEVDSNLNVLGRLSASGLAPLSANQVIIDFGLHPSKLHLTNHQTDFVHQLTKHFVQAGVSFGDRPIYFSFSNLDALALGKLRSSPQETSPLSSAQRFMANPNWFRLELTALIKARQHLQTKNFHLILPELNDPHELFFFKKELASLGLVRSPSFQLLLPAHSPAVILSPSTFLNLGISGLYFDIDRFKLLSLGSQLPEFDSGYKHPVITNSLSNILTIGRKLDLFTLLSGLHLTLHPEAINLAVAHGVDAITTVAPFYPTLHRLVIEAEQEQNNESLHFHPI
jgi:pyruvate,water dikinase